MKLTAVFEKVSEGYIGFVEELPGANTQGETLEEARSNLAEAVELVLEANRALAEESIQGKVVTRKPSLAERSGLNSCVILNSTAASFSGRVESTRSMSTGQS